MIPRLDYFRVLFFLFTLLLCLSFTCALFCSRDLTTYSIQLNWTLGYSYLVKSYWFMYLLPHLVSASFMTVYIPCNVPISPLLGCTVFLITRLFLVLHPCPNEGVKEAKFSLHLDTLCNDALPGLGLRVEHWLNYHVYGCNFCHPGILNVA